MRYVKSNHGTELGHIGVGIGVAYLEKVIDSGATQSSIHFTTHIHRPDSCQEQMGDIRAYLKSLIGIGASSLSNTVRHVYSLGRDRCN